MGRSVILENTLMFDPLSTAAALLGEGDEEAISAVGFKLLQENMVERAHQLMVRGDSHFGTTPEEMKLILKGLGLQEVYSCPITPNRGQTPGDTFYVFAGQGLLACFDTYRGAKNINSGNVYYNWKPLPEVREKGHWTLTSGGGAVFKDDNWLDPDSEYICWAGGHDIREGIAYRIGQLRENGEIMPTWYKSMRPWLVHYGEQDRDTPLGHYDVIRQQRIAELPTWVQDMIRGEILDD